MMGQASSDHEGWLGRGAPTGTPGGMLSRVVCRYETMEGGQEGNGREWEKPLGFYGFLDSRSPKVAKKGLP